MWSVHINHHACEGRKTCLEVCPTDVFDFKKTEVRNPLFWLKTKVHGGMQAFVVNENGCIGCMKCVIACPEVAIVVVPRAAPPEGRGRAAGPYRRHPR